MAEPIDAELLDADGAARALVDAYVAFGGQYRIGEVHQWVYSDILEFLNFLIETAEASLVLASQGFVADALGLCRSLLENYLLLKLICRGTKAFHLQDLTSLSEGQFKAKVRELQAANEAQRARGEDSWLEIRAYPRPPKRHVMLVFEGLHSEGDRDFLVPLHYFQFIEFQPDAMGLDAERYFEYYEAPPAVTRAQTTHREGETYRYKHYLSYDALLEGLALNGLAADAEQARIEAHYTFLGKFLHPTHGAARQLHERANVHDGQPGIGMRAEYSGTAALLVRLYIIHLVADMLDEIAHLFESAPQRYIKEPGTSSIRQAADDARKRFGYFWLIYNEAPFYDRWLHAVHHLSDEDLKMYGDVAHIPTDVVKFNQHIYRHLAEALGGWHSGRCGAYVSPLARHDVGSQSRSGQ